MPVYEYACTECGERLEVRQSFTDEPLTVCPACAGKLRKVLSAVGVVFKGSGFYRTDSRANDANGSNGSTKASDGSGSGGDTSSKEPTTTSTKESAGSNGSSASTKDSSGSNGSSTPASSGSRAAG